MIRNTHYAPIPTAACVTDPVLVLKPKRRKSRHFPRILAGITIIIGLWLAITFAFPVFEHWIYLRFFLICAMGFAFLGITYLVRT
jgi:fatty acid desaturase